MTATIVEVHSLVKRYGELTALNDVSFDVHAGEIFGILGPNGAGKTTTLEIIEGLRQADSGHVLVDGLDVSTRKRDVQQRIGVQLQASALPEYLRVGETLELFSALFPPGAALPWLGRLGLEVKRKAFATQLSGGQQQRLSLALALVNDPVVVFLDEPTTGLDPQARHALRGIISEIRQQGKTIVLTTHSMEEAEELCDRLAIMERGKVVALGSPSELIRQLATKGSIECRFPAQESTAMMEQLAGVAHVERVGERVFLHSNDVNATLTSFVLLATERSLPLDGLQVHSPTLEDVFLALTGHALRDE
jgi:ABC-2 type transport system ATP-binding protein